MAKGIYDRHASLAWIEGHKRGSAKLVGRHDSIETRNKKRISKYGEANFMFGKKRTPEERRLMSLRRRGLTAGEKNPNWRGGKSKIAHTIRTHPEYGRWRKTIVERDNYTCQMCGKRGGDLHVDHYPKMFKDILQDFSIKSIEEALACEALWDIDNNRTLCVSCHRGGLP